MYSWRYLFFNLITFTINRLFEKSKHNWFISANIFRYLTCASNAQNSPSQASAVHERWTSRYWKGRGTRDKIANIHGSSKNQEGSRKTSTSALLTMPKSLTVWITVNCGKLFKRWEYQTTWPASWETYIQVRKQQLELDMKQQTGSK